MHTFMPSEGFIYAKRLSADKQTKSGLFLPDDSKVDAPKAAYVINVPTGLEKLYKTGDLVMYKSYASHDIKVDNEDYIVLPVEDILGTLIEISKRNQAQAKEELAEIKAATTVQV